MPQRIAQEDFRNLESLIDIPFFARELVAQTFLRIPIAKRAKPSRSIEF
jgi:hypothetical protein